MARTRARSSSTKAPGISIGRDGRRTASHVYFNYGFQNGNTEQTEIFRVAVDGRGSRTCRRDRSPRRVPAPSPDGRGLFFAANPEPCDTNLWWRDLASGRYQRLTFGIGEYGSPSISADGRRLVAMVQRSADSRCRVATRSAGGAAVARSRSPTATPATSILLVSRRNAPRRSARRARAIGISGRPGRIFRNRWRSTSDSSIDERPAYSPDGTQVAFVSDRGGRRGIWVVSADGGTPRRSHRRTF